MEWFARSSASYVQSTHFVLTALLPRLCKKLLQGDCREIADDTGSNSEQTSETYNLGQPLVELRFINQWFSTSSLFPHKFPRFSQGMLKYHIVKLSPRILLQISSAHMQTAHLCLAPILIL